MGTRKTAKSGYQHSEQIMLRQQLKAEPHHHWILTRLSSVYYEQRRYALALKYAEKAFAEVPSCALVLWDYAGALQMLGRHNEALDLYARVVTRGVDRIANGECGEGRAWARGLISDSHYRASLSLKAIGNERASSSLHSSSALICAVLVVDQSTHSMSSAPRMSRARGRPRNFSAPRLRSGG